VSSAHGCPVALSCITGGRAAGAMSHLRHCWRFSPMRSATEGFPLLPCCEWPDVLSVSANTDACFLKALYKPAAAESLTNAPVGCKLGRWWCLRPADPRSGPAAPSGWRSTAQQRESAPEQLPPGGQTSQGAAKRLCTSSLSSGFSSMRVGWRRSMNRPDSAS